MIEIIENPAELRSPSLEKAWNELAAPLKSPLLRHEWFAVCAESFAGIFRPIVLLYRQGDGMLAGVAPLALTRAGAVESLEILGTSVLYEPGGLIYGTQDSLKELCSAILSLKKPLFIRRLPADETSVRELRLHCRGKNLIARQAEGTPFIPITSTWERFVADMSSSRRSSLNRARGNLEKKGRIGFEIISPNERNFEPCLRELIKVEASGWKKEKGTALLVNEGLRNFFTSYAHEASRYGMTRFCFLRIDDAPIAAMLGVEYANRFWILKTGYDEKWSHFSPGALLIHETIKYAFERGLESYEFLGRDEPWIHTWTRQTRPYASLRYYPYSLGGIYTLIRDAFTFAANRLLGPRKTDGESDI